MNASPKMSLVGAILMNVNLMVGASAFMSPGYMTQYAETTSFNHWLFAGPLFPCCLMHRAHNQNTFQREAFMH